MNVNIHLCRHITCILSSIILFISAALPPNLKQEMQELHEVNLRVSYISGENPEFKYPNRLCTWWTNKVVICEIKIAKMCWSGHEVNRDTLDNGKKTKWQVSSYFYGSISSSPCGGSNHARPISLPINAGGDH